MIVIIMGVAGAGKTTVGAALALALGWRFIDADDLHSQANREKIAHGEPLSDADRSPWLEAVGTLLARASSQGEDAVVACSALRRAYRDRLEAFVPGLTWVFLRLELAVARSRLVARRGHFAPAAIIEGQYADLEPPYHALQLDASRPADELVDEIARALGLRPRLPSTRSL